MSTGTGVTADAMRQHLERVLEPMALEVIDESAAHAGHAGADGTGSGTHFRVRIASPAFAGLGKVAQHRLVYDALRDFLARGVHALALETSPTSTSSPRNLP
ncbi:BolA family protein [Ramlibacter rhizophilus]|uniref:BolA family transcriptional regulator n=1 Tax=Ramlibacter rhizophilus TaxID=1781167 RepID=A0A4Z0C024_9BURK|nr:BolA family protein [Ramlibacter rhizophilus]TFZ04896.1 BolA family transcriptional regulator [Ramlibacter rhizophilus]